MSIIKTFLGYHDGCGGKVYQETGTLFSHVFCTSCISDSASTGFNRNDIVSDLTSLMVASPGGNIPLTDDEYKLAYNAIIAQLNACAYPATNYINTLSSGTGINGRLEAISDYANNLEALNGLKNAELDEALFNTTQSGLQTASTDATIFPPSSTTSSYWYDARASLDGLIDSSSGVWDWSGVYSGALTTWRGLLGTTADTSVDSVLISSDFTTPHAINDVYLLLYEPTHAALGHDDWTRGTDNVNFQVSVNGGVAYTNAKWVDYTSLTGQDIKAVRLQFETPGSVFKWKATFAKQNYPRGFLGLGGTLSYKPVNNLTSYLYTRYV